MKETQTTLLEKEQKVENENVKKKIVLSSSKPQNQTVIDTPNYDLLPSLPPEKEKILIKIEKEVEKSEPKKKPSYLRRALAFSIIGLTFGLGVFTAVDLASSITAYNAIQTEYSVNLATLMQKIASVDSGNKASELIETFPSELIRPDELKKQSNWFDRLCNFLSGLFS